jgi:hypothetical protein
MRQFAIFAAAAVLAAALSSVAARAEFNYGPVQNGNQCWKSNVTQAHNGFGYWTTCPQPASAPVVRAARRHHQ